MALFGLLPSRRREVVVYVGGRSRDRILGMPVDEVYRSQPELQAVVSFLASSIAQLPLKCYLRESDESRPRDTEGVLPQLLGNPGAGVTGYQLVLQTASDLLLYGWALWWVLPSADTECGWEMRAVSPMWVRECKTVDGFQPSSYVVSNPDTTGVPVEVSAGQCVRFATYNPGHPTVPLSPVEGLKQVLEERASSRDYRNKVWQNGGWFSRYIERPAQDAEWSPEARKRFASSIKNLFAGPEGVDSGGMPILEDGMRFVDSTLNAKEAEWAESMRLTREDVAAAYHVNPASVWSSDGQTYASVRENARSLYADTLGPTLRLIQDAVNLRLVPMVGADPRTYAEFDLSAKLAGSFEEQATVLSQSVGGPWMTRNEARARQNLPAIDGGDELIVPLNVTEGGLASPHDTDPTQGYGYSHRPTPKAAAQAAREGATVRVKAEPTDRDVKGIEEVFERFYERQATSIANELASMEPDEIALEGFMEWWHKDRWVRELSADLIDVCDPQMEQAAKSTLRQLGLDSGVITRETYSRTLELLCRRRADDIVQSTLTRLARDLLASAAEGWTKDDVRSVVRRSYERLMESRVHENSSSLAQATANAGTWHGAKASGKEVMKVWVATGYHTRPSHAALSGTRVALNGRFPLYNARWPGDDCLPAEESCNCHCRLEIETATSSERRTSRRVERYSDGWEQHGLGEVVGRLVPDAEVVENEEGTKRRYVSDKTPLQVVVDNMGQYFRIIDSSSDLGKKAYVGIDGEPISYDEVGAKEYRRLTHFKIKDESDD